MYALDFRRPSMTFIGQSMQLLKPLSKRYVSAYQYVASILPTVFTDILYLQKMFRFGRYHL